MHLKNGVLRDLRKSMYDKIIELPYPTIQKKRKGDMARMFGMSMRSKTLFFYFRTSGKEPLTIIFALLPCLSSVQNGYLF
jgi:subfamily B ATP-binding cassette protein MsbA